SPGFRPGTRLPCDHRRQGLWCCPDRCHAGDAEPSQAVLLRDRLRDVRFWSFATAWRRDRCGDEFYRSLLCSVPKSEGVSRGSGGKSEERRFHVDVVWEAPILAGGPLLHIWVSGARVTGRDDSTHARGVRTQ